MTTAHAPGFYVPGAGWLHRLDPRAKLWFAVLGIAACLLTPRLDVLAGLLALTQIVLLLDGLSARQLGGVWKSLGPLVLIILILQPVLMPGSGPALAQVGPLRLTSAGLGNGLRYALRLAAAAFAVLIPVMTTSTHTLVRGLEKLGLPYTWGMMIGLALRYLGTVGGLYSTIMEAQQARGLDLSERGLVKRARVAVPTLIALIVASLRLSDSLALGLAARGFGGQAAPGQAVRRTSLHDIVLTRADWLAMIIAVAVFAGLALAVL